MTATNNPVDLIDRMEAVMVNSGQDIQFPTDHQFYDEVNGVRLYRRTIFIPKDHAASGVTHLFSHPFFLMQGTLDILDSDGNCLHITAPYVGDAIPGTRKIVRALEDCVFITCHVTTKTTPEEVIAEISGPSTNPLLTEAQLDKCAALRASSPDTLEKALK